MPVQAIRMNAAPAVAEPTFCTQLGNTATKAWVSVRNAVTAAFQYIMQKMTYVWNAMKEAYKAHPREFKVAAIAAAVGAALVATVWALRNSCSSAAPAQPPAQSGTTTPQAGTAPASGQPATTSPQTAHTHAQEGTPSTSRVSRRTEADEQLDQSTATSKKPSSFVEMDGDLIPVYTQKA